MERDLPSGRVENLLEVVTPARPNEVTVRASEGATPFTYRYRLREVNGGTALSLEAEVELEGAACVARSVAVRAIKRGVDANLKTLKRLLEER